MMVSCARFAGSAACSSLIYLATSRQPGQIAVHTQLMLRLHGAVVAIADLKVNAVTVWGDWM